LSRNSFKVITGRQSSLTTRQATTAHLYEEAAAAIAQNYDVSSALRWRRKQNSICKTPI